MDLLVNVSPLQPPLTGIGRYTRYLLEQLMLQEEIERLAGIGMLHPLERSQIEAMLVAGDDVAVPNGQTSKVDTSKPTALAEDPALKTAPVSLKRRLRSFVRHVPMARTLKSKLDGYNARRHAARYKDFVYWEPNYLLLPIDAKPVNTVYDLSHIAHPEYHPAERVKLMEQGLHKSIEQSEKIVVISEFTRQQVAKEFGVTEDRMAIVPPAVSDEFRIQPTEAQLNDLKARYKLPEQFLLSVATLEPRKNLHGLARAFARLPAAERKAFPLVLVGCKGWNLAQFEPELAQLEARGELIRLGYVSQQDLPMLFSAATAMAYVSFYEGYGMPIAESMAAGTPVITSNCTSMPEVAAGCATLVDPNDGDQITEALAQMLADPDLRKQRSEAGLIQSASYTWEASGDSLFNLLKQVQ